LWAILDAWQEVRVSIQLFNPIGKLSWLQPIWISDAVGEILLVLFGRIFWKDGSHPKHPHHLKGFQVVFQLSVFFLSL
jgi:hypothetical protein